MTGRSAPHVHHKNEVRTDDRPENLEGKSKYRHISDHTKAQWADPEKRRRLEAGLAPRKARGPQHGKWRDVPKDALIEALEQNNGILRKTGKSLGISLRCTRNRVKLYGIDWKSYQNNHRITCIEERSGKVDVYDIEVEGEHNFIANELCVHNSSSGPNLQNMPRILGPRECFIPRPGRRWWMIDYEQVEMKFFAHFAEDDFMIKAIAEDIHLAVAAEIYHLTKDKVSSEQRKRAKGVNFGIIYGSGAATMAETLTKKGIITSIPEAALLVAAYHRRFPSVRRATNKLKIELNRTGYLTNPFGRRYHIPKKKSYIGLNYECQGTSADLMKQRMVRVWLWLRKMGYKTKIILQVHDELGFEMPRNEEHIIPQLIEMMEDLTSYRVPITVDAKCVTKRWSKKHKPSEVGVNLAA